MKRGGRPKLYKLSRFTLLERKAAALLEADVYTVLVIEEGKSSRAVQ